MRQDKKLEALFTKQMLKVWISSHYIGVFPDITWISWLYDGFVKSGITFRFLPGNTPEYTSDPRTKNVFSEVEVMKEGLHEYWINKTVRALVICWMTKGGDCVNQPDSAIIDERKRMSWWISRIREDESVLWW